MYIYSMRHFVDLGTHKFEGLGEFTEKLNLNKSDNVYCYEPNKKIYEASRENNKVLYFENKFHSFKHFNLAVVDYNGTIKFNSHVGAWNNCNKDSYNEYYTTGSNCLEINPSYDSGNGFHFDIISDDCNCIDIEEIISSIVLNDKEAEIYIKCDIEGSEFIVLPKLIKSKYISNIKCIYIEWHERFWYGTNEYENKVNERTEIITKLNNLNVKTFIHT
jgi:FkbM family methyltransferase